jgi:predicted nucleic acid-binding protein
MSVGLLDTSVVIDWDDPDVASALPDEAAICAVTLAELDEAAICAVTLAELAPGPHLASSACERPAALHAQP